jgi:hypothetical protein
LATTSSAEPIRDSAKAAGTLDRQTLARIVGFPVGRGVHAEEDGRMLSPGILWRRRRLRFSPETHGPEEALCVNELTIDPGVAHLEPVIASDHAHMCEFDEVEAAYWATWHATGSLRARHGMREPRLFINMAAVLDGDPDLAARAARDVAQASSIPLSPGHLQELAGMFGPTRARLSEGHNPSGLASVARWLPAVPPSRLLHANPDQIAAVAGGFYLNFPEEYDDNVSALHQPIGLVVAGGHVRVPAWIERPAMAGDALGNGRLLMSGPEMHEIVFDGGGLRLPLARASAARSGMGRVYRRWENGSREIGAEEAELRFTGATLYRWGVPNPEPAPIGGAVVIVSGEAARRVLEPGFSPRAVRVGLVPALERETEWALAAGPMLVLGGETVPADEMLVPVHAGEFGSEFAPPLRFPYDVDRTVAPRTAIGRTASGAWKVVVVDGRRRGDHSMGLTLLGLAELCRALGCVEALNLDGGGSAVMALAGAGRGDALAEHAAIGVVNIPSDEDARERVLPVVLTVQARG